MAELLGPDANSRQVWLAPAVSAHGRTATIYTDAAATALAAILTYDGTGTPGAAVTGSQVTIDADSQLPRFWFPNTYDTLYVRVNGMSGIKNINADYDARLDVVTGWAQAAAVADQGALTATTPAALTATTPAALTATAPAAITSTDAAGATPTDVEYEALRADVVALRATVAALVTDAAAMRTPIAATVVDVAAIRTPVAAAVVDAATARTKVNALLASLRTSQVLDT